MRVIKNQTFDEERALYGSNQVEIVGCQFDGDADGESACKECSNLIVDDCYFNLRYPFWHNHTLSIKESILFWKNRESLAANGSQLPFRWQKVISHLSLFGRSICLRSLAWKCVSMLMSQKKHWKR